MGLLETDRLFLRPLSLDDLHPLTKIISDPAVMEYSIGGVYNEEKTSKFIEWCIECYEVSGVGPLAVIEKLSSKLIGFCGLSPETVGDNVEISLGYRFARESWGKGFATESAQAVVSNGFTQHNYESMVAVINPDHSASINVAEKVGFTDFDLCDFHDQTVRLYRLNQSHWKASNPNPE